MVDGVADHVGEGIAQHFHGAGVELHVVADRHEHGFLLVCGGDVADGARVLLEERPDGHHPGAHDQLLQLRLQHVDLPIDWKAIVEGGSTKGDGQTATLPHDARNGHHLPYYGCADRHLPGIGDWSA